MSRRTTAAMAGLVWVAIALTGAVTNATGDELGSVVLVDGSPRVIREGRQLTQQIRTGFGLENYDAVRTDSRSSLRVDLDPAHGVDAWLTMEPDTELSVNIIGDANVRGAAVELVAGSVGLVARSVGSESLLRVRTSVAEVTVRGTGFRVTTGIDGACLVTVYEGLVQVSDPDGRLVFASPGAAVELSDAIAAGPTVLSRMLRYDRRDPDAFVIEWRLHRADLLAERAPEVLRSHAERYLRERQLFVQAYADLMRRRAVIDSWMDEDERGVRPPAQAAGESGAPASELERVRSAMLRFESALVRLERMAPFVSALSPEVELENGFSAADVYRRLRSDRAIMRDRFATVRYVFKLYAQRLPALL